MLVFYGWAQSARCLLSLGADATRLNRRNESPLYFAAKSGNAALVSMLLPHYKPEGVNQRCRGETALIAAVKSENVKVRCAQYAFVVLLPAEPVRWCTSFVQVMEALIAGGADVNAVDPTRRTPLHVACAARSVDAVVLVSSPLRQRCRGAVEVAVEVLLLSGWQFVHDISCCALPHRLLVPARISMKQTTRERHR
jgi:hypothetical protein